MFYILWAMATCSWIEWTNKYNYNYSTMATIHFVSTYALSDPTDD